MSNIKQFPIPRDFLPKQKEVLEAVKNSKYTLYSGAFGAGKTLLMCNVAIQTCINNSNVLGLFASQTVPMLRDTVLRTFMEEIELYQDILNKNKIGLTLEKKWRPSTMSYEFYNGSTILFRSADTPSKFKSLNLDFFLFDEPVDIEEDIFLMLQGRLRAQHIKRDDGTTHRFGAMAGNPAGKMNWVYQRFFEHPTPDYYRVHTTTKDNIYLPEDYIQSMYDAYDFEYARRYLEGEWGSFVGLVYKDFSYDQHVGDYSYETVKDNIKYYIAGVDVGFRNPTAICVFGISNDNKAYQIEEYYKDGMTTDATVQVVGGLNKKYNFRKVYVDPSAADWSQKALNLGIKTFDGDNDIDSGIAKIKSLFANDLLFIDRKCEMTLKELESYQYDKDRIRSNLTEKPMKKADHMMDSWRYCLSDFNPWRNRRNLSSGKW